MATHFARSLVIFRRDLRLDDNSALRAAVESSQQVIPCFIFDSRQLRNNPYRGEPSVQFMLESLESLQRALNEAGGELYLFEGKPEEIVARLVSQVGLNAVFVNRDYTPYSQTRDRKIQQVCAERGVAFEQAADALLTEPEAVHKEDGSPYTVYTPFARKARTVLVPEPQATRLQKLFPEPIEGSLPALPWQLLRSKIGEPFASGGAEEAQGKLAGVDRLANYATMRDLPSLDGTTGLSAHLKYGTISVRRVYQTVVRRFGPEHTLINELLWRDFFTHIGYHFPHVFAGAFHARYDNLEWSQDSAAFERWCNGTTGFPIVDAGMRQLNQTGYMHNRVRMIVASFLVKDLHIDWRWGERYFAQRLTDYDPSVNNGNWQWAASTGCDAVPYFRIFNPWLQQKKFDPECRYIYRWLPEVASLPPSQLHALHESASSVAGYPAPMVDHRRESLVTKQLFVSLAKGKT